MPFTSGSSTAREQCPHQGCSRSYASVGALRNHLRCAHTERRMLPRSHLSFKARAASMGPIDEQQQAASGASTLSTAMALLEELLSSSSSTPSAPQLTQRDPSLWAELALSLRRTMSAPPDVHTQLTAAHPVVAARSLAPSTTASRSLSASAASPQRHYRATTSSSMPYGDLAHHVTNHYGYSPATTGPSDSAFQFLPYMTPAAAAACTPPHPTVAGVVPWHMGASADQHDNSRLEHQHFQHDLKYRDSGVGDILQVLDTGYTPLSPPTSMASCSLPTSAVPGPQSLSMLTTPYSSPAHPQASDTHTGEPDILLVQEICALMGIGGNCSTSSTAPPSLTATRVPSTSTTTLPRTTTSAPVHQQQQYPTSTTAPAQLYTATTPAAAWSRIPFAPPHLYTDSSAFAPTYDPSYSPRASWSSTSSSNLTALELMLMDPTEPDEIDIWARQMSPASSPAAQDRHPMQCVPLDTTRYLEEVFSRVSVLKQVNGII